MSQKSVYQFSTRKYPKLIIFEVNLDKKERKTFGYIENISKLLFNTKNVLNRYNIASNYRGEPQK